MKIKEKSTEEKTIIKYLLRLRQPRIKKKENRYYIRGYKGTEVIIRTDHEILKRIAYRRTCVKQVCIPGRYETETKYIYTRKENRRSRPVIVPGIPAGSETVMPRAVRTVLHALSYGGIEVEASRKLADLKKDLFMLRMQHATNQLDNPLRIADVKKDIARIKTIIRENETK